MPQSLTSAWRAERPPDDEINAVIGWAIDTLIVDGNVKAEIGLTEWRALARQQAAIQLEVERRKDERDRGERPFSAAPSPTCRKASAGRFERSLRRPRYRAGQ